jgi:hypothetical protein
MHAAQLDGESATTALSILPNLRISHLLFLLGARVLKVF